MENEKTTSIFRTEKDKQEFVRLFRETTMSGAVSEDVAVEKLIRDNPRFFYQPTEADIAKISRSGLNDEIRRRAQQTNKLADGFFRG
jgi:hypothetical protein